MKGSFLFFATFITALSLAPSAVTGKCYWATCSEDSEMNAGWCDSAQSNCVSTCGGVWCGSTTSTTTTSTVHPFAWILIAEDDILSISLYVAVPSAVVIIIIILAVCLRSRTRRPPEQSYDPQGGIAMTSLPIAVDNKPDTSTPMSAMKQHFLSQFLKLLPQGIIDENKMIVVGTGGFARVYVAEVRRHCSHLPRC